MPHECERFVERFRDARRTIVHIVPHDVNDVNDHERSAFNIVPHDVERISFSVPHDVERCERACRTINVERRTISFSVQHRAARRTTYDSFNVQHVERCERSFTACRTMNDVNDERFRSACRTMSNDERCERRTIPFSVPHDVERR